MNTYIIHDARLVADPEDFGKNGKSLTSARLADNTAPKDDAAHPARFVKAKFFGKAAEQALRLKKGDVISVTGGLQVEAYTDKQGQARTADVLLVDRFKVQKSESFFGRADKPADPDDDGDVLAALGIK